MEFLSEFHHFFFFFLLLGIFTLVCLAWLAHCFEGFRDPFPFETNRGENGAIRPGDELGGDFLNEDL